MSSPRVEAVINLHFHDPCIVTPDEFEEMVRDAQAAAIAEGKRVWVRVILRLAYLNGNRYREAKEQNEASGGAT